MSKPPKAAEQWLIQQQLGSQHPSRMLTSSLGRAQLAQSVAETSGSTQVDCLFLDLYRANLARAEMPANLPNLTLLCEADPPDHQYDLAAIPLGRQGESELVRELIQSFFTRLAVGGQLWVAVDNPTDRWVREQLDRLDAKITSTECDHSVAYCCTKLGELKKQKKYECEFAFRDRGRLLKAYSRPGVFSHRRIDPGARHLIDAMELPDGASVLDIGCGAGTISTAAAAISAQIKVTAIDSHCRAVESTRKTAALNDLDNVVALLTDTGQLPDEQSFDVVLANPPYYANFRIAELFLDTARRALRPGGKIYVVGKDSQWYSDRLQESFTDVSVREVKGYVIAEALQIQ